jgi:hypothetical protein
MIHGHVIENDEKEMKVGKKKRLKMRVAELEAKLAETEKKRASAQSSYDTWYKTSQEKTKELDRIHAALDVFPFAPRTVDRKTNYGSVEQVDVSVEGRIMAILGQLLGALNFSRSTSVKMEE